MELCAFLACMICLNQLGGGVILQLFMKCHSLNDVTSVLPVEATGTTGGQYLALNSHSHHVVHKTVPTNFCPYLRQKLTDFKIFFHRHNLRKIWNKTVIKNPATH